MAKEVNSSSAEMTAGRSMPESLAAEAGVLGSMIIDPECIGLVVEKLKAEDFYRTEHRMIFEAVVTLYEKNIGGNMDAVLLRDELEKRKQMEEVGGVDYLKRVMESVPSSANVEYYSNIVKEKALLRQMIAIASEIVDDAYDQGESVSEKLDRAEAKIFQITNSRVSSDVAAIKDLVTQVYEQIEKRSGKHITGLPTGYIELDELTCGLQKGEMIIIAGRPSIGKTSLALNIAEHLAIEEKKPLAIFSLEMGWRQLTERFLCSNSGLESQLVRKGMLETADHEKLIASCGVLADAQIYIDDSAALTPLEIRAKSRRFKSRYDIQCIFVDYLQLMSSGAGRIESRQQEITAISRYLKALARELNIPVVVLSQLNRSPETREHHRPRMSDLRESGSIEQDADVVMLLHREDYYHKGEEGYSNNNKAELIIAKQRNGPTGSVELVFLDKLIRFENASPSYVGEQF